MKVLDQMDHCERFMTQANIYLLLLLKIIRNEKSKNVQQKGVLTHPTRFTLKGVLTHI